jgi:hypothetical protein
MARIRGVDRAIVHTPMGSSTSAASFVDHPADQLVPPFERPDCAIRVNVVSRLVWVIHDWIPLITC